MPLRACSTALVAAACVLILLPALGSAQAPPAADAAPANELDQFMERVLARREVNRKTLEQYILDEKERFEILGPGRAPLYRTVRDYSWYVRDGMHVRSPLRFNGVAIDDEARRRYEGKWVREELERRERKAKRASERAADDSTGAAVAASAAMVPTEPRFVSEAYFLEFKFEPGNYYLVGRETLEGHEVLRIEYYPTRLFGDRDDRGAESKAKPAAEESGRANRDRRREQAREEDIERKMNKTALVTLWVDPAEHQIVRYTFDNVWLDFLPGAWLVRIDEMRASMKMGQPFPGVWLPLALDVQATVTLASGSFTAGYDRTFSQYRLAEVSTTIRVPKVSRRSLPDRHGEPAPPPPPEVDAGGESGPFVATLTAQDAAVASLPAQNAVAETIGEIRIHGNAFLTDQEVLNLAGIAVGELLPVDGVQTITARLEASRHFDTVEVRKRYRSLTATNDIALVLLVHERPGVRSATTAGTPGAVAGAGSRLRSKLMFLPIVSFADGYGLTYGGRVSTVDLLGANERLSVPATWGGTRRVALEFERLFNAGPLTRIEASIGLSNRENPRFEVRDQRTEVRGRAERVVADLLRLQVEGSRSTISFAGFDDRLWTIGTSVTLDTRLDPAFPANAIWLSAGWTGMHFTTAPPIPARVDRYSAEARGYLRVFRQIVLAGRAHYTGTDRTLPPYERLLLGGAASVRGFRTGSFDGDRTLIASAELRVPITSVLNGAKLGVTAFVDAGRIWNTGDRFDDTPWRRGVGGGLFLIASIVRLNLDVAHGLSAGTTRLHLSSGFTF